jgi:dolichol-phosphate mannosyltransferase
MSEFTIIIPTLNEAQTIRKTVNDIMHMAKGAEVLVMDDDSSDDTHHILNDLAAIYPNFHYVVRFGNHGLSNSLVDGFQIATTNIIMVMDADGQHPPQKIEELYQTILDGNDVAIASRYLEGGGVWYVPLHRRLLSWGATYLARFFFPKITDTGSGFFAFRKGVIKDAPLQPQGFRMLFEILGKGKWETVKEIPYILQVRQEGQTKLKGSTVLAYLKQLWGLLVYSLGTQHSHGHDEIVRLLTFVVVGASGIVVNIGTLYLLTEYADLWYVWSACIGVELSILTNFFLNDHITFSHLKSKLTRLHRFGLYHFVSVGGIIITILTMSILVEMLHIWYIVGSLVGIGIAFVWNFTMNRGITWGE